MLKTKKSLKICGKGSTINMNKKQYNNIIEYTLKHDKSAQIGDSLSIARAIFNNMGVALPQGDIKAVYKTIKTNKYMSWRYCSAKQAQTAADNGIAAIGINENRIIVLSAADKEQPVAQTASVMTLFEDTLDFVIGGLNFYLYGTVRMTNPTIYCNNSYLTQKEMASNAQYILNYLRSRGWTKNAVCGMLGNMQTESTINPGLWQSFQENNINVGFGLVQWTPALKFISWAKENGLNYLGIDSQLMRLLYEVEHEIQWYSTPNYPISFSNFTKSTQSPSYLAAAFIYNYKRPENFSILPTLQSQANYWYNNLS